MCVPKFLFLKCDRVDSRARRDYVFLTDGDYVLSNGWIEEGLKLLSTLDYVGVEGKIYYVPEDYVPTYSDHVCVSRALGNFMTGKVEYRRDARASEWRIHFLTDGDCTVSHDWTKQGLESLQDLNCIGVEGRTYCVSEEYEPSGR